MENNKTTSLDRPASNRSRSQEMGRKIVQISGGNAPFGDMLRQMMWTSYCDAGQPFGATEEGMYIWIEHHQQTTTQ